MQLHSEFTDNGKKSVVRSGLRARKAAAQTIDCTEELGRLRSLASRQALQIREIDHRAKNSLQLAASMLMLQARRRSGNAAATELERAVERLHALAEIHRASYQAEDLDEIPIRAWIGNLCRGLVFDVGVDLQVTCPDKCWPFKVAGPAGLFIGEALTNACKHAFPDRRGRIEVTVEQLASGKYRMTVADDGVGLAADSTGGLGGELLSAFARQLGGELSRTAGLGGKGHCVSVEFFANA